MKSSIQTVDSGLGGVSVSAACLADIKSVDWIRFQQGMEADRCV